MGLQDFRNRLQTDKQLQMIVGASAMILVALIVVVFFVTRSSSQTASSAGMGGDPSMAAPGMDPNMAGAPAATPATTPTTDASATTASASATPSATPAGDAQKGASGPPSLRKGMPTMPYRPDPFEKENAGGTRVPQMFGLTELPRLSLPPIQVRPRGRHLPPPPAPIPTVKRRVAGIMLDRVVSAILEEEGSPTRVIQPGDQYIREGGVQVRVEKIEADGVTLREGKHSVRVPLKASDVERGTDPNQAGQNTPGYPMSGMAMPPGVAPVNEFAAPPGMAPRNMRMPGASLAPGQVMQPIMPMP